MHSSTFSITATSKYTVAHGMPLSRSFRMSILPTVGRCLRLFFITKRVPIHMNCLEGLQYPPQRNCAVLTEQKKRLLLDLPLSHVQVLFSNNLNGEEVKA